MMVYEVLCGLTSVTSLTSAPPTVTRPYLSDKYVHPGLICLLADPW